MNNDYRFWKSKHSDVQVLIYFDSRGSRLSNSQEKDFEYFELMKSFLSIHDVPALIITREKELTTIASLLLFLDLNNYNPKTLITNVGFVDYTPKKLDILLPFLDDAEQTGLSVTSSICEVDFRLSNGDLENLYSCKYSETDFLRMGEVFKNIEQTVMVNTAEDFRNKIFWDRKRPACFYKSVYETNKLIEELRQKDIIDKIIDIRDFSTFDGIHFNKKEHKKLHDLTKQIILNERRIN